ncbi:hypothetical protein [Actinoallomurus sp. CA-150999]|uniref:hypothetical protein n=1 Tax=Actinoallomurus sp. CA-150999 TaxID=3239887 RepID=UPI003D8BB072
MNRTLGRHVATAAATLAVAGGAALALGGTASAAPVQDAHRTTVTAHVAVHGDNRDDDRYRDHGDGRRRDGGRAWEGHGRYWYGSESRRYRVIDHRLYYWSHGAWRLVTWHTHGHDFR